MLVLVAEACLGFLLIRCLGRPSWRKTALKATILVSAWTLLALTVVQWELLYLSSDGTYGSDARYYYQMMRATLESGAWWPPVGTLSPGYVAWGVAVLRSSPTTSVVWVKMANVGLLLLTVLLGFIMLRWWRVTPSTAYVCTLAYALNGTVTWMVVRNLKDGALLFLTIAHVVSTKAVLRARLPVAVRVVITGLIGAAMGTVYASIRPWGLYWSSAVFVGSVLEFAYLSIRHRGEQKGEASAGLRRPTTTTAGVAALAWLGLVAGLTMAAGWDTVMTDSSTLVAFSRTGGGLAAAGWRDAILAIPRFMVGPGPIRALWGWETFLVTTSVGNVLIAMGSALWWLCLPVFVGAAFQGPRYWVERASLFLPLTAFTGVYAFAYAGSVETRFRAIVYVLGTLLMSGYIDELKQRPRKLRTLALLLVGSIIWVVGVWESYRSIGG